MIMRGPLPIPRSLKLRKPCPDRITDMQATESCSIFAGQFAQQKCEDEDSLRKLTECYLKSRHYLQRVGLSTEPTEIPLPKTSPNKGPEEDLRENPHPMTEHHPALGNNGTETTTPTRATPTRSKGRQDKEKRQAHRKRRLEASPELLDDLSSKLRKVEKCARYLRLQARAKKQSRERPKLPELSQKTFENVSF